MQPSSIPPSPGRPPAELLVDAALARGLVAAQHADLGDLPVTPAAEGWDNAMFRLGDQLALRLPRREIGARLIVNEQRWLPVLAPRLPLAVPAPLRIGVPQADYPWPWSIVPWLEGETADLAPPDGSEGPALAACFRALHVPAPPEAPVNAYRGVPLASRRETFEARLIAVRAKRGAVDPGLEAIWQAALAAPDDAAPTWIHGDTHPRNVLVREGRFSALIDWGDMARGDRASDLAGVWMLLPQAASRAAAMAALPEVSAATWARARGWAALYVLMLMEAGLDGDARMGVVAMATQRRLVEDAGG